jgi:hypothetical protein
MRMWRTSRVFSRDKERNENRSATRHPWHLTFSRTATHLRITSCLLVFTTLTYTTYENQIHSKIKTDITSAEKKSVRNI